VVDRDPRGVLIVQRAQVVYANHAAAALFGRPGSGLTGFHVEELLDFVPPLDRDDARLCLAHDEASPRDLQADFRVVRSRGEFRVIEAQSVGLTFAGDPARRVLLVDVTGERRQRGELRRSRDELRAILAGLTDAILVTDPFDQVVYANDAACDLLGFVSRDDLMKASGQGLFEYVLVMEQDGRRVVFAESPTARAARDAVPLSATYFVRQADRGVVRFVTMNATPVLDMAQRVSRVVTVFHDLTDIRRAETERRRLESEILRAQKSESLAVMAGGIAHDFNNLLMIIRGNVDMASQDETPPEDLKPYIHRIGDAANRAAELARQMLAYTGRASFEVAPVKLNVLVPELQSLLRSAISRKARLDFSLAEDLPEVLGDATRLRQVVLNLVKNASDALEDGPGEIRVSTAFERLDRKDLKRLMPQPAVPEGAYVVLTVSDTGAGIAPDLRGRIFEPFFTTRAGGRGLGLAACEGIVRSHGGGIAVESKPGNGATFRVLLPLDGPRSAEHVHGDRADPSMPAVHRAAALRPSGSPASSRPTAIARSGEPASPVAQAEPAVPPPFTPAPPASPSESTWRGSGIVLLADDEPDVRFVARRHLEKLGFDVVEASNGGEALDRVRERPHAYACAVLDYAMPVMNGAETASAIRALRADLPIIIASGYTAEDLGGRHGFSDVTGLIEKPYERARLAAVLRRALERTT
jgi:PAS domain S-box-containing protein